jgi:ubiquinone/menaquinone biosynthesis C-methylase UbiE
MDRPQTLGVIETRYNDLAEGSCCLSCGTAMDLAEPKTGEVCVDLGSGRGRDVISMAGKVGPQGRAYGVDTADRMLARARRDAEKLGVTNAEFLKGELDATGLEDGVADLLISNCTINHAADKESVWREVYRVLKPGGRFVVSDIYATEEVPEQYRNDPQAVAECWAGAVTREEYIETLHRAGFESIRALEESSPYDKGAIQVASITLAGVRPSPSRCCAG